MMKIFSGVCVIISLLAGQALSAQADPFKGGTAGGNAHKQVIANTCQVTTHFNFHSGGAGSGSMNRRSMNSNCMPIIAVSPFNGGRTARSFHAGSVQASCLAVSPFVGIHGGGSTGGSGQRRRIYNNCFGPNSTIASVTPTTLCQGESVVITGTHFSHVDLVTFSNNAHTGSFSIIDSTRIEVTVPPGAVSGPVEVSGPEGTAVSNTVLTISPLPVAGFTHAYTGGFTFGFTSTAGNATSYYWEFGDGGTSTAANPSHTFEGDGIYPVLQIVSNDCGSDTLLMEVEVNTVGIATPERIEMTVIPNPFKEQFQLSFSITGKLQLRVFNMLGQVVYNTPLIATGKTLHTVEMAGLPPGIYTVQVNGPDMPPVNRRVVKGQ